MNLSFSLTRAFVLGLLSAAGFALFALLLGYNRIAWFDNRIISLVGKMESPGMTSVMKGFTFIGYGKMVLLLSLTILFLLHRVFKHRRELVLFGVVVVGSGILNFVLKSIFHRERPTLHRMIEEPGFSFPSGHSMAAFALYGISAYLLWRHFSSTLGKAILITVCAFMILAIGTSRIYLGVHYPSDVAAGFLASGAWLALSIYYFEKAEERRKKRIGQSGA
ncbi:phosphatase PAP2 family protein [Paenibacillus aurantius]|uniref:Phosphatase PAP2 family protein n=1 Tax=Paenibacillus aurantius TaxID=2918900 RepID=A0AA96LBM6_9BACL|nr:phosphatase PAP2 family protein [Paenibacillus aurantius]WNQ09076.1 phosphatase PAP2 family protein [Paenibacillus aurantius]